MNESRFKTQLLTLNYAEGPDNGPTILMLHGGGGQWLSLMPIIPELSMYLHVYAIDLRGHGKSEHGLSYRVEDYVVDALAFIKDKIQKPTLLFGNSLGAMAALMLAAEHPEWVKALIVTDPPISLEILRQHSESQSEMAYKMIEWIKTKQFDKIVDELKDKYFAECVSLCDPKMLTSIFHDFDNTFAKFNIEDIFSKIKCPTLIIRGNPKLGSLIAEADIKKVEAISPYVTSAELTSVGHSIMDDKLSVLEEINIFLEKNHLV